MIKDLPGERRAKTAAPPKTGATKLDKLVSDFRAKGLGPSEALQTARELIEGQSRDSERRAAGLSEEVDEAGVPWCYACRSYHDDKNPTCFLRQMGPLGEHHKLEAAARLIEEHMTTLDLAKDTCGCCNRETYHAFGERQEHVELTATVRKLRGYAAKDRSLPDAHEPR